MWTGFQGQEKVDRTVTRPKTAADLHMSQVELLKSLKDEIEKALSRPLCDYYERLLIIYNIAAKIKQYKKECEANSVAVSEVINAGLTGNKTTPSKITSLIKAHPIIK